MVYTIEEEISKKDENEDWIKLDSFTLAQDIKSSKKFDELSFDFKWKK